MAIPPRAIIPRTFTPQTVAPEGNCPQTVSPGQLPPGNLSLRLLPLNESQWATVSPRPATSSRTVTLMKFSCISTIETLRNE